MEWRDNKLWGHAYYHVFLLNVSKLTNNSWIWRVIIITGGDGNLGEGTAETLKEAKSQAETFAINVPML